MKKQLLSLIAAGSALTSFAQLPVSTTPSNKNIVLEEFTGIYCGYCPDGHTVANNIANNNPGRCVLINIHSGGYATVATGEPDLKTTIGNAITSMPGMGITGYPAGAVNRTILTGTVMSAGRSSWTNMANTIKNQSSFCNVAVEGNVDATTRVLTYTAQVYYTANSPVTSNSLTVVLLEDKVLGPQHNYGSPNLYNASNYNADGSYNHNHVLRAGLTTGNFGITIPVTTAGTTFSTTGTYTIPATYGATGKTNPCLLGNIELAAFVTQSNSLTVTGNYGPIHVNNIANVNDAAVTNVKADAEVCLGNLQPTKFNLVNNGSANLTNASITYSATGGAVQNYTFNGNLAPFTQTVITLPAYTFPANATNSLNIALTSVNGGTDQNAANDVVIKSIPLTTKIANNPTTMSMEFTQDQYGSELTWEIREEGTNALVTSGGPYADLSASGVLTRTITFSANPNTCYKVIVNDSYGDGFNAGAGAGNYKIKSGGVLVYTMNGVMGETDTKLFRTSAATGVSEISSAINEVVLFPNPSKNNTTLTIDLIQNETITVNVVDVMGRTIHTENLSDAQVGKHNINLTTENWANGVYNVNISTSNGTISRKLVVSK